MFYIRENEKNQLVIEIEELSESFSKQGSYSLEIEEKWKVGINSHE